MSQILMTTTGAPGTVNFPDLGSRDFVHPVVDLDLVGTEGFSSEEILASVDLAASLDAAEITLKDAQGTVITSSADLGDLAVGHGLGAHTDIDLAGVADKSTLGWDNGSGKWAVKPEALPLSQKAAVNGVASLDAGGKIPAAQIPAVALPTMSVVTDEAARLLLVVEEGDEAKQTDDGSHWIYDGSAWIGYPGDATTITSSSTPAVDTAMVVYDGTSGTIVKETGITVDGSDNITIPALSTVDGRDLSVDGSKLDNIEANAKDDQIAADVPYTPLAPLADNNVQDAIDSLLAVAQLQNFSLWFTRNNGNVSAGTYLRGPDALSTDAANSPPVSPFDATIQSISCGLDGGPGGAWVIELEVNGVVQVTLNGLSGVATAFDAAVGFDISAGDRIGVKVGGTQTVARPSVMVVVRER